MKLAALGLWALLAGSLFAAVYLRLKPAPQEPDLMLPIACWTRPARVEIHCAPAAAHDPRDIFVPRAWYDEAAAQRDSLQRELTRARKLIGRTRCATPAR